ncbi:outer membrane beta-barrel family protein [Flavobacterium sp. SUN046]|uniref:outer membrane beta-barrel family protein n=1 Tax=Flavobacterium sp. SUN046 TaxID=3002440 RepID=UPI002DBDDC55|nr:outer membrane beta-barrel family protein [Flavobacterium sp. SUN046]MEC4048473.1 outer membrane beta-barrel family protein [Flavobacterium sp. SUN046]
MRSIKFLLTLVLLLSTLFNYSQDKPKGKTIKITGKVIEKGSKAPLEYTSIAFINTKDNTLNSGGVTNDKGEFTINIVPGDYTVKFDFISFKVLELKDKTFTQNTNLGSIELVPDATQLKDVVITAEKTTVDIKLDKKVYNVGKDLMVKGGTVSDLLDNIPSVSVDAEGNVSLRGNDNVKILVDGRPSNAINIADALRMIPADAIEKVEVITNPSARYDAEGGGGIINIILKKGKNQGLNGTLMATTGDPANHGLSASLNYKSKNFNLFTTQGYNYRNNPGNSKTNTHFLNTDTYLEETRKSNRISKGYNGNFGMDWYLDKSLTWTNIVNYRRNTGTSNDNVFDNNFDSTHNLTSITNRLTDDDTKSENIEYTTNFTKNFTKKGHKLTVDGNFSRNTDDDIAVINGTSTLPSFIPTLDNTKSLQKQERKLYQTDYVLPLGKNSQFEAGYRGNFLDLSTDYQVINNGTLNTGLTNVMQYKEKVNAAYSQFGTKYKSLSMLFGMRFEDSKIDINQLATNEYNKKRYNNFFPSTFFTYEFDKQTSISLNYSKRINRPRGRELNPFSSYSSNINMFRGNPDLNPAITDAIELGFLKRWEKLTFNTSAYYNQTKNSTQMFRYTDGLAAGTTIPLTITGPVNVGHEYRYGLEFTLNYSPYKWWKLNSNFNFYNVETKGIYSLVNTAGTTIVQDFGKVATTWFTKFSSKVSFPNKLDWQTNFTYNAPQNSAQGKSLGIAAMNLSFSKDILKDKATLALNVNDVFNSRKRKMSVYTPGSIDSYSEMQFRVRQITLSFTYRFNKQKSDKEKLPKSSDQPDDMQ